MFAVYAVIMHSLWIPILGFCAVGWGLSLVAYLVSRSRARKTAERYRLQIHDLASQVEHHASQHDENREMLLEVRCQLLDANARCAELEARLDKQQPANLTGEFRRTKANLPKPALPSAQARANEVGATQLSQFEEALSELRRTRDLAEQRAEALRAANQEQMRKNTAMAARLEELAVSMEETRVALTDKERRTHELSAQLRESMAQIEALSAQLHARQGTSSELGEAGLRLKESERASEDLRREIEASATNQNSLSQQLEERTAAFGAVERMLQESTATELQLRRDLRAMAQGREQLELQNLELKLVIDQMGDSSIAVRQLPPAALQSQDSLLDLGLGATEDWSAVTETDIGQAIVGVAEKASPVQVTTKPSPVKLEVAQPEASLPSAQLEVARTGGSSSATTGQELRAARLKIEVLEANMSDLEYLREQNARLSDEWAQDRGAARELTTLQLEHKRLRLDLQLAGDKLAEQAKNVERLAELTAELQERKTEQEAITRLNRQVRELGAENFALRNANSGTYRVAQPVGANVSESHEIAVAPLDSAVLSDNLGLAIAGIGSVSSESLAAVSGLALSNAERVRELLPVGPIATVQWVDQYGMTVTCKLLRISGDEMAMTTLGAGLPSEEALRETLRTILSTIGWTETGPVSDDESHVATG